MAEVPGDEVIDLVERGEGEVDGVGEVFAVKDAAFDVAFGEDGGLFDEFELLERADEIEIAGAMRFGDAFEFAMDKDRAARAVFVEFVLPPADSQVAAQRLAVVEIRSDYRGFEIEARFH